MFTGLFEHLSPPAYPSLTPPTFPLLILSLRHATAPPACFSCSRPASRIAGRLAAGTAASPPSQRRGRRHGRCGSRSGRRRPGRRRSLLSRTQQGPPPPRLWQVERVGGWRGSERRKGGGARAEGRRRAPRERGEASGSSGGSLVALVGEVPCWVRESRDRRRPGRRRPDREPQRPCLRPRR